MKLQNTNKPIQAILIWLALCSALLSHTSYGLQVADVSFSPTLYEGSLHPKMQLNGAALRELYLLVDSYAGALYLEAPSKLPANIINSDQHKRMVFHVLMKKVSARRIGNALREALLLNISPAEHSELQADINTFLSFFEGNIHKGQEVVFHYVPNKGTHVSINEQEKGWILGKSFMDAFLKVWIGQHPVSREFKEQILGN